MKHFFARSGGRNQIIPGFGLTMGMSITMLSLLILIPLASVLAHSLQLTANDYAKLITDSGIRNAFITSISCSVLAALVNCVFGFILAFARGLGEYGSVIYISGNSAKHHTQVVSYVIMQKLNYVDYASATAIALAMLVIAFVTLFSINMIQVHQARRVQ